MADQTQQAEASEQPGAEAWAFSGENKRRLIQFGFFCGILLIFFALLVLFTVIARGSWQDGLRSQTAQVLGQAGLPYELFDAEPITNPLSVGCASFRAGTDGTPQAGLHAVIIRMTTLYGPVPAVYLYDERTAAAEFVAFATIRGKAEAAVQEAAANSQTVYWGRRIPAIVGGTAREASAQ